MRIPAHHEALRLAQGEMAPNMERVDDLVRGEFEVLAAHGDILGAFAFGSTQFGDHSTLSDYDMVVAIKDAGIDAEMASLDRLHRAAKRIYGQTGMPLEVTCYTDTQLQKGRHTLPTTFLLWLQEQRALYPQNVIGADFVGSIRPKAAESSRALAEVDKYATNTRHLLQKNWLQGCYFRPHDLLSVTLSVPHIVGRKSVDTLEHRGNVPRGTLKDLSKESIRHAVAEVFGEDKRLVVLYDAISADMRKFTHELVPEAAKLSADEYDQIVEAVLEDNLPKSIELLRRIQEAYDVYNTVEPDWYDRVVEDVRTSQLDSF